jgi:hypothetical protein
MYTAILLGVLLAVNAAAQGRSQAECGAPIEREHTVCQRCYEQFDSQEFNKRVYVYVPDIKSKLLGGFDPFDLWIVEGIYGPPFLDYGGVFQQDKFEQLKNTGNVIATRIPVDKNALGKAQPFKVGKSAFRIEPVRVETSYGGTDRVTLKICR